MLRTGEGSKLFLPPVQALHFASKIDICRCPPVCSRRRGGPRSLTLYTIAARRCIPRVKALKPVRVRYASSERFQRRANGLAIISTSDHATTPGRRYPAKHSRSRREATILTDFNLLDVAIVHQVEREVALVVDITVFVGLSRVAGATPGSRKVPVLDLTSATTTF